jgi:polyisoprenoid-binding protein YceI
VRNKLQRLALTLLCLTIFLGASFQVLGSSRDYEVSKERSKLNFSFAVLGMPLIEATFNDFKGTIVFDSEEKTGNAQFSIDLRSVETGITAVNERMQEPELLFTESFPIADFKSSALQFEQERLVKIEGDLTIKGTTRNVEFKVQSFTTTSLDDTGLRTISAVATAVILRSDFGAGKYAPFVGNQVRIQINLVAVSP